MTQIIHQKDFAQLLQTGVKTVSYEQKKDGSGKVVVDVDHEIAEKLSISFSKFKMWKYQTPQKIDDNELFALVWVLVSQSTGLSVQWVKDLLCTTFLGIGLTEVTRTYLFDHFTTMQNPPPASALQLVLDRLCPQSSNNADKVLYWTRYEDLVGRESEITDIIQMLTGPHPLVCIGGLGGIGKTSLANEVGRRLLGQRLFDHVVWVSAAEELPGIDANFQIGPVTLTTDTIIREMVQQINRDDLIQIDSQMRSKGLKEFLRAKRTLLILDNLELVHDASKLIVDLDLELFMGSRSAILVTSRRRISYDPMRFVELNGLPQPETIRLVRQLAEVKNLPIILEASDETQLRIHAATGGHPLAIKLIIGKIARTNDLESTLSDLQNASVPGIIHFYRFVFFSLWKLISENARYLLLDLVHLPADPGEETTFIQQLQNTTGSHVPKAHFHTTLAELRQVSLVESYEWRNRPWYALHTITRNFILSDIVHVNFGIIRDE